MLLDAKGAYGRLLLDGCRASLAMLARFKVRLNARDEHAPERMDASHLN